MFNCLNLKHAVLASNGTKIWYVAELIGTLMEYDCKSCILKSIWDIPGNVGVASYRGIYYYNGELYILPFLMDRIYVYNPVSGAYDSFFVKNDLKIMSGIERNGILYFYGWKSVVIKMDTKSKEIKYIDVTRPNNQEGIETDDWFWTEAIQYNRTIFLPRSCNNSLVSIDENDETTTIALGDKKIEWRMRNLAIDNDLFRVLYLLDFGGEVKLFSSSYRINGEEIETNEIRINYEKKFKLPVFKACYIKDRWIILPYESRKVYLYDNNEKRISATYELNSFEKKKLRNSGRFLCYSQNSNCLIAIDQQDESVIEIETNGIVENGFSFPIIKRIRFQNELSKVFVQENCDGFSLSEFIGELI